jgi:hypothetical protein
VPVLDALARLVDALAFRLPVLATDVAEPRVDPLVCEARVVAPLAPVWRTTLIKSSGKSDARALASFTTSFACRAKKSLFTSASSAARTQKDGPPQDPLPLRRLPCAASATSESRVSRSRITFSENSCIPAMPGTSIVGSALEPFPNTTARAAGGLGRARPHRQPVWADPETLAQRHGGGHEMLVLTDICPGTAASIVGQFGRR